MHSYVRQNILFAFLTLLLAIATTQSITPSTPSLDPYDLIGVSCSSQGLSAYCIAGGACCADNTCCGVGLQCVSDSSTGGYGCEASKPSSSVNAPSSVSLPLFLFFPIEIKEVLEALATVKANVRTSNIYLLTYSNVSNK